MNYMTILTDIILLHLTIALADFNLDLTDRTKGNESLDGLQHDCLHLFSQNENQVNSRQILSFCLTERPAKWKINKSEDNQTFTFADLSNKNITSEQLYLWSAPVDTIEHYQLYLDQPSISTDFLPLETHVFHNCSPSRFGPLCQYSLDIGQNSQSSLNDLVRNFFRMEYNPPSLNCYTHLTCDRGSRSTCLDWTEICDEHIDCRNEAIDEEHCWQLFSNECQEEEFRCLNGQCISKIYLNDQRFGLECLDQSDKRKFTRENDRLVSQEPSFFLDNIQCSGRFSVHGITVTSSCVSKRNYLLQEMALLDTPYSISDQCWLAFKCKYSTLPASNLVCTNISRDQTLVETINNTCSDEFVVPAGGILYGHIYLAYRKEVILVSTDLPNPQYICYDDRLCGGFYPNRSLLIGNMTCRRPEDFPLADDRPTAAQGWHMYATYLYRALTQCNTIIYSDSTSCSSTLMYQCVNSSKCITKHRLCNGINDCDYKDDEQCNEPDGVCSMGGSDVLLKCTSSRKCISTHRVQDRRCDCGSDLYGHCDDETRDEDRIETSSLFQMMCNGFTELISVTIDGRNETDETECEYWSCNNNYTRCNDFWNCLNGADEVNCHPTSCPPHHHTCVSAQTSNLTCLPINKANDGIVDCVGGMDEPKRCRSNSYPLSERNFYCENNTTLYCTSSKKICSREELCTHNVFDGSDEHQFLCSINDDASRPFSQQYFLLGDIQLPAEFSLEAVQGPSLRHSFNPPHSPFNHDQHRCHRGLPLRIWLDSSEHSSEEACLCPANFYGDACQYQNQRVSLTVRFRTFAESRRTLFTVLISLIDDSDARMVHSHQQLTYYYYRHCGPMKFNVYLLYSTRPKQAGRNYSAHIDVYEKLSLAYRASFLIPIRMAFLPVYRIATVLNIPPANDDRVSCSDRTCVHGRCRRYVDDLHTTSFCQCHRQWSGKDCTIPYTCDCSRDALCVGVAANNRSICVCPLNRWGARCLLRNNACQADQDEPCLNGGRCLPDDGQLVRSEKVICICPNGFTGPTCDKPDNKITVIFPGAIALSQAIAFHFIQINTYGLSVFGSIYKTVPFNKKVLVVHWSHSFHLALARVFQSFYIIVPPQAGHDRINLTRTMTPADRCDHMSTVWKEEIAQLPLLRRMKYYHLPCQRCSPPLSCFYDDTHFCFCDHFGEERMANCFQFNDSTKHNCFGQNRCENGAECLQDKPHCPQTSICVCAICFYGRRCQFTSSLFSLSLDAILGYHIRPHVDMIDQPAIVQFSLGLTIIMVTGGMINGIVSLLTFKNKPSRELGCGFYLLGSSLATLFGTLMFILKFSILLAPQMTYITNRSFLHSQCSSIDFLLRISLNMDQWLNASVAAERAVATMQGTKFNKRKSRQMVVYVIPLLLTLTVCTNVHDPLYRRLMDDNSDDLDADSEFRIWCIVSYPSRVQAFNLVMNIFHFCLPFTINLLSALVIVVRTTRQQAKVHTQHHYRKLLQEQFLKHKHILIAPVVLVLLALPRLIISLVSGCLTSVNEAWLFLIGYFISFIPLIITSLVFVLPSKLYKKEFQKSIKQIQHTIVLRMAR